VGHGRACPTEVGTPVCELVTNDHQLYVLSDA
jgi:hypothetical protein